MKKGTACTENNKESRCSRYFRSKFDHMVSIYYIISFGGFLIGFDSVAISGALLLVRAEFPVIQRYKSLQGTLVSFGVAGGVVGFALGGWISDKFGRKPTFVVANFLIFFGALLMSLAPGLWLVIIGRLVAGTGAGLTSMNVPLYISEACPPRMRGTLTILNDVMIVVGQLMAYNANFIAAEREDISAIWRWLFVFEAATAIFQCTYWMVTLPESPRWLYRKGKKEDAVNVLNKMYFGRELKREVQAVKSLHEAELLEEDTTDTRDICTKVKDAWSSPIVRDSLPVGIGLQVFQQLVGISAIVYYGPTILQIAGIASVRTAITYSGVIVGLGALGSGALGYIVRKNRVKCGRKKLMIISMVGIIACLGGLVSVFTLSNGVGPKVNDFETARFGNSTCPAYLKSPNSGSWNCKECLDASSNCGFCSNTINVYEPGSCLIVDSTSQTLCESNGNSEFFTRACPSKSGEMVFGLFALFSLFYSIGMGTIPGVVNSEIVPLKHKDICSVIASMATGFSTLVVCQWFLSLLEAIGPVHTFAVFGVFSVLGLFYIIRIVPETKDMQYEEVETTRV
ncbi:Sugar transporter [Ranunculus cassubicifolius]